MASMVDDDPRIIEFDVRTDEMLVNMGPQHPSTHGVLRLVLRTDGEVVSEVEPHIGYLHRCAEKIGENLTHRQFIPYTDRMDYLAAMNMNLGWALAVEKLMKYQVSEKARHLRVLISELNRIASHLVGMGAYGLDLGTFSPFLYAFREREKILDLFESLSGARMMCNYMRFGGCRCDLPPGWLDAAKKVVAEYPKFLDEFETLLSGNEILMARTQGVGKVSAELAVNAGLTGPMLRASGVDYDLRKVDAYGIYARYPFRIPLGSHGDVYDRYMVRMLEMRESLKILEPALKDIPEGPVVDPKAKLRGFRPKAGEAYGRIESAKGELGFYLISDGSPNPYRYRVRPPSLINLTVLEDMCLGQTVADAIVSLGSVDIVLGEVDR